MLGKYSTHANFSVNDIGIAKEFYVDKLGFRVVRSSAEELLIESEKGTRVNIYYKADHEPWNSTVLGVEVDGLRACIKDLQDLGITFEAFEGTDEDGVMSIPGVGDAAWFRDPAGNWVCVSNMNEA